MLRGLGCFLGIKWAVAVPIFTLFNFFPLQTYFYAKLHLLSMLKSKKSDRWRKKCDQSTPALKLSFVSTFDSPPRAENFLSRALIPRWSFTSSSTIPWLRRLGRLENMSGTPCSLNGICTVCAEALLRWSTDSRNMRCNLARTIFVFCILEIILTRVARDKCINALGTDPSGSTALYFRLCRSVAKL